MTALTRRLAGRIASAPQALLDPVLGTVVRSIVAEAVGASDADPPEPLDKAAAVMQERIRLMPRFLGYPMMGATVAFELYGVVVGGRLFHQLSPEKRRKQIQQWRDAPISFFQDFLDFYEKMGVFAYFTERFGEEGEKSAPSDPHQAGRS
jgi:hypothetical protein